MLRASFAGGVAYAGATRARDSNVERVTWCRADGGFNNALE